MILADSGYWVALSNRRDHHHVRAAACAARYANERLVITWSVLTEAHYLIATRVGSQQAMQFIRNTHAGACDLIDLPHTALLRMHTLMGKYRDLPMDLADASLVVLAEQLGEGRILSTDTRDFGAYRWKNTKPFSNLMEV